MQRIFRIEHKKSKKGPFTHYSYNSPIQMRYLFIILDCPSDVGISTPEAYHYGFTNEKSFYEVFSRCLKFLLSEGFEICIYEIENKEDYVIFNQNQIAFVRKKAKRIS